MNQVAWLMPITTTTAFTALCSVFFLANQAKAQPTITNLGVLPSWSASSHASGISDDGSTVVGYCTSIGGDNRAFRWTLNEGMQNLGALPGGSISYATHVNADGTAVTGGSASSQENRAILWTPTGGMQNLGILEEGMGSVGTDVSADGYIVVGNAGTSNGVRAFMWQEGSGLQALGPLPGHLGSLGVGVDDNNQFVTGVSTEMSTGGGRFQAVRWNVSGMIESLGALPGYPFSLSSAICSDGSIVAGTSYGGSQSISLAFRWRSGIGMQSLGILPGHSQSLGNVMSADGSIVGGACYGNGSAAFIWTPCTGMIDLQGYLTSLGLDMTGWRLTEVRGISATGDSVTGQGFYNNQSRAWLVRNLPRQAGCIGACDSIDFNRDSIFPDSIDIADFLGVFGGSSCSTNVCGDIDFNNDALFPDVADINSFLSVFSGGPCL